MKHSPAPIVKKYGIRIPSALKTQLTALAAACGLSESEVIAKSIKSFLKIVGQNKIIELSNNFNDSEKYNPITSFHCSEFLIKQLEKHLNK